MEKINIPADIKIELNYKAPLKFLIATDGSDAANMAFKECLTSFIVNTSNFVTVVHVFEESKTYLQRSMQPNVLKSTVDTTLTTTLPPKQFALNWIKHNENKTTKEEIVAVANTSNDNFLVLGYIGRKKSSAFSKDITVLGSSADFSIRKAFPSVIIMKKSPESSVETGRHFVVCVDGSTGSLKALSDALLLAKLGNDKITLLHIAVLRQEELKADGRRATVENKFIQIIKKLNTDKVKLEIQQNLPFKSLSSQIIEYIDQHEAHFVVLGADHPQSKNSDYYLGSTSDSVVRGAPCNVIVSHYH